MLENKQYFFCAMHEEVGTIGNQKKKNRKYFKYLTYIILKTTFIIQIQEGAVTLMQTKLIYLK